MAKIMFSQLIKINIAVTCIDAQLIATHNDVSSTSMRS